MVLLTWALLCGSSHAAPRIAADLMDEGSVGLGGQLRAGPESGPGVVVFATVGPFVAEAQAGPGVLWLRGGGGVRLPIDLTTPERFRLVLAPSILAFHQDGLVNNVDGLELLGRVDVSWLRRHPLGLRAHLGGRAGRYVNNNAPVLERYHCARRHLRPRLRYLSPRRVRRVRAVHLGVVEGPRTRRSRRARRPTRGPLTGRPRRSQGPLRWATLVEPASLEVGHRQSPPERALRLDAAEALLRSLSADPVYLRPKGDASKDDQAASWRALGELHQERKEFEEAVGAYRELVLLGGAHAAVFWRLGRCLDKVNRGNEVVSVLLDGFRQTREPELGDEAAWLQSMSGQHGDALDVFRQLRAMGHFSTADPRLYSLAAKGAKNWAEVVVALRLGIAYQKREGESRKRRSSLWSELAEAHRKLGDEAAATAADRAAAALEAGAEPDTDP